MERLIEIKTHVTGFCYADKKEGVFVQDVFDKLAAYEDTGLTPEEVHRLKAKYEALESDKNVIESSHINAEMNLEAQQQDIESLQRELNAEISVNEALTADKDEQAGRIMQMEEALRQAKTAVNDLMACNEISKIADVRGEEAIRAIDALLGGKEDEK